MNGNPYFAFLRYCLDDKAALPPDFDKMDWAGLFRFMQEQALLGVGFEGINKVSGSKGQGAKDVPREVLLPWLAVSEQIRQRNVILNNRCVELTEKLSKDGFQCCVLKGQGNALMYPNPYSRTPGDIDIWSPTQPSRRRGAKESQEERRNEIIQYVREHFGVGELRYYHVEFDVDGVPVEMHFMPGIMNNPIYNRRLQRWYKSHAEITEIAEMPDRVGKIPVPTAEFNIVFQLAHMMHHFFDEGIGLRQFVDYFYLLKANKELEGVRGSYRSAQGVKGQYHETLSKLNLYKFAGAVMYVMREVFHLEEQYMIAPVDEWRGRTLLNEILKGGNFGRSSNLDQNSAARKYFQKTVRNMHFVWQYPAEALCEPFFRTWHFFWRMAHR